MARSVGGGTRPRRYYSMQQAKISMEDKESLERVGRTWVRKTTSCGTNSKGDSVWSVQTRGEKAKDPLGLVVPYLAGSKKKKALCLLDRCAERTSLPVKGLESFLPFS
jgi:hypothetical protein